MNIIIMLAALDAQAKYSHTIYFISKSVYKPKIA